MSEISTSTGFDRRLVNGMLRETEPMLPTMTSTGKPSSVATASRRRRSPRSTAFPDSTPMRTCSTSRFSTKPPRCWFNREATRPSSTTASRAACLGPEVERMPSKKKNEVSSLCETAVQG